jgi:hypothetical protein
MIAPTTYALCPVSINLEDVFNLMTRNAVVFNGLDPSNEKDQGIGQENQRSVA